MSLAFFKAGIDGDDREAVARFCEVDFSKSKSMTSQAMADEADINKIVARVIKGQTVMAPDGEPFYGDVSEFGGLQEAIIKVQEADELFMQVSAEIREKFDNDPVKFIDFLANPDNMDEGRKLGLIKDKPKPIEPPVPEPVVSTPARAGVPTQ